MSLPGFLEPENARVTIPLLLLAGYVLYHWWRWRMLHPRIDVADLPTPSPKILKVADQVADSSDDGAESAATSEIASETVAPAPATAVERPAERSADVGAETPLIQAIDLWSVCIRDEVRLDRESGDPAYVLDALRRAQEGRPEYYVRLGEYAWFRGAMIEAHYWLTMGRCHGVRGLSAWRAEICQIWVQNGHPNEDENVHREFPYETAFLARALMSVCSGIGRAAGREFIVRRAEDGDEAAQDLRKLLEL